jgi:hypothetical protein
MNSGNKLYMTLFIIMFGIGYAKCTVKGIKGIKEIKGNKGIKELKELRDR